MARQEEPPQQVDAGGMGMIKNALWIPERGVELQLRLCVEAHCRSAGHRAYEATLGAIKEYVYGQRWPRMSRSLCRTVCTVSLLFVETKCHARPLSPQCCEHCLFKQKIFFRQLPRFLRNRCPPDWYAATRNQAQQDPALRLSVHRVVKRREVSVLATSQGML
jgi:hypothetical protein